MAKLDYHAAIQDEDLVKIENVQSPDNIGVFTDREVLEELPEITILDYVKLNEIEYLFIPVIPKPLDSYEFYEE